MRYTKGSERCASREVFTSDRRGVTLIELGVAIGILVLLMAIAVPVFSAMRRQREMAGCALNLKTIGAALRMYWEDWGGFPVAFDPRPTPCDLWIPTGSPGGPVKGLGLFTLYNLYINPDADKTPCECTYTNVRADYLKSVNAFNCPANPVKKPVFNYGQLSPLPGCPVQEPRRVLLDPYLGGFNNYDWFYQRSWGWDSNCQSSEPNDRNLLQRFPPDDTVVTWCPMHRNAAPEMPTAAISSPSSGPIHRSDWDLVLWVDGSVERLRSQSDQHLAEPPEK